MYKYMYLNRMIKMKNYIQIELALNKELVKIPILKIDKYRYNSSFIPLGEMMN